MCKRLQELVYRLKGEGAQNAYLRLFGRGYCRDALSTPRRTTSRVMQLTAGQRSAAVSFIKQLYLDRPRSYGLKVRAINSQSSERVPATVFEIDAGVSDNWLRNVYPRPFIGFPMLIIIELIIFVAQFVHVGKNLCIYTHVLASSVYFSIFKSYIVHFVKLLLPIKLYGCVLRRIRWRIP
jgi:hypothetical protein